MLDHSASDGPGGGKSTFSPRSATSGYKKKYSSSVQISAFFKRAAIGDVALGCAVCDWNT